MFGCKARYLVSLVATLLVGCGNSPSEPGQGGSVGGVPERAGASGSAGTNSGTSGDAGVQSAAGAANAQNGGTSAAGGANPGGGEANGGAGHTGTGGASSAGSAGIAGSNMNGGAAGASGGAGTHWQPGKDTTFYWDLSNSPPDNTKNVGAYDIDGFGNTAEEVAALHARGLKVVCYMDAGSYEPGRPDSSMFPASLKGSGVDGWPGEFWLDVRAAGPNLATLKAIMLARFKVCQQKGFDAVEPDNLDSYQNKPGFATTAADQLAYNQWLATTAHGLGLAVFQKNDLDQVDALQPYFDGILDEECNEYSECATLAPYSAAGKPVWDAEYKEDGQSTAAFCSADAKANIVGALFALDLDGSLFEPCPNDVGLKN